MRRGTIILTTHYLEEAEALCRNMAIINHGKIVTNRSIKELLRDLHKEAFILTVPAIFHRTRISMVSMCRLWTAIRSRLP